MAKKQKEAEFNLFDELTRGLEDITDSEAESLGIIEFIDKKIDAYDMQTLLGNRVVLKAFYNEPMDEEETNLLQKWVAEGKTNWKPPEEVIAEENLRRALEDKPPKDPKDFQWRELVVEGGMRSGKTQSGAFIILDNGYRLMMTPRTQWRERFGINIPQGVPVYITCLAATADSTERTIYGQVCSYMRGSRVFKKLIDQGRLIITDSDISFPENDLTIVAGNSRAAGQVGRLAVVVVFDELAFLANDQGKSNAKDLYDRLGRSTTNLGSFAKIIAISSVKEEGDYMQELQQESWDKQHLGCLCFRLASWDMNETLSMDHPVIAKAYASDPVTASRDYENIRPAAEDSFLNSGLVDMAISHEWDKHISFTRGVREVTRMNEFGKEETRKFVTLNIDQVDQLPVGMFSVAHCDPGVVKDSFAMACGRAEAVPEGIATVIDFTLDWIPLRGPKGEPWKVDFLNVEDVLLELAKKRNIMRLTYDHWQGEDHIQRLWRAGVAAREDNFNGPRQFEGYTLFRERLNAGLIKIPNYPALLEELKNLILKNGSKIDHPKKMSQITKKPLSKDLADCIMAVDSYIAKTGAAFARTPHQSHGVVAPRSAFTPVGQTNASRINWKFR